LIGVTEILVVGGIALLILLFGSKKIPELARSIGRTKKEFERGQTEGSNQ